MGVHIIYMNSSACLCIRCFDAVIWVAGMASSL